MQNATFGLSEAQDKSLVLISILPAILSIAGSSTIICLVYRGKFKGSYHRLLFGASVYDICFSLSVVPGNVLIPKETSQRVWALGNEATCSAMGFMGLLGGSSFYYSGILTFYYLCIIRFGVKDEFFARRIEPWLHLIAVGFPLAAAAYGAARGKFGEKNIQRGCYLNACIDGDQNSGGSDECASDTARWILVGLAATLIYAAIIINNVIIVVHVCRTVKRSGRRASSTSESHDSRIGAVAAQAFLYVAAMLLTYMWSIAIFLMEDARGAEEVAEDIAKLYPLLVLESIFLPMQGFFNLIIYVRPRYLQCRSRHLSESRFWAVRRVLFSDSVPTTAALMRRRDSVGSSRNLNREDSCISRTGECISSRNLFSSLEPVHDVGQENNLSKQDEIVHQNPTVDRDHAKEQNGAKVHFVECERITGDP
jgi:hypothetical protein